MGTSLVKKGPIKPRKAEGSEPVTLTYSQLNELWIHDTRIKTFTVLCLSLATDWMWKLIFPYSPLDLKLTNITIRFEAVSYWECLTRSYHPFYHLVCCVIVDGKHFRTEKVLESTTKLVKGILKIESTELKNRQQKYLNFEENGKRGNVHLAFWEAIHS